MPQDQHPTRPGETVPASDLSLDKMSRAQLEYELRFTRRRLEECRGIGMEAFGLVKDLKDKIAALQEENEQLRRQLDPSGEEAA